jgi:hypothetical protein
MLRAGFILVFATAIGSAQLKPGCLEFRPELRAARHYCEAGSGLRAFPFFFPSQGRKLVFLSDLEIRIFD